MLACPSRALPNTDDAAAACAEDHFELIGREPVPSWKEFARFLAGGKFYE